MNTWLILFSGVLRTQSYPLQENIYAPQMAGVETLPFFRAQKRMPEIRRRDPGVNFSVPPKNKALSWTRKVRRKRKKVSKPPSPANPHQRNSGRQEKYRFSREY
ncbi:hypothetical protein DSO57_1007796 [Entomophthora muscae]|uniref:Uncharacterized protein n=1 Tax=Entomophthora muscae TaxID=34485 RepID=A0ACC2RM45_9FUNG|nr:hypothetical protein DSO57_1007796 [Entomophthora muscae]